jgi:hypothetical protein
VKDLVTLISKSRRKLADTAEWSGERGLVGMNTPALFTRTSIEGYSAKVPAKAPSIYSDFVTSLGKKQPDSLARLVPKSALLS